MPRPDLAFTRVKVAVFVDGCFWHGCPEHGRSPNANDDYWRPKLRRNQERDRDNNDKLRADGWLVLRYWEHEPLKDVVDQIERAVTTRQRA